MARISHFQDYVSNTGFKSRPSAEQAMKSVFLRVENKESIFFQNAVREFGYKSEVDS